MFCHRCGNKIPDGAKFCAVCGAGIDGVDAEGVSMPVQMPPTQKKTGNWKFFAGPFIILFGILLLWGLLNVLASAIGFQNSLFMHAFKVAMPVLILLAFMLVPIGIVIGLVRVFDN